MVGRTVGQRGGDRHCGEPAVTSSRPAKDGAIESFAAKWPASTTVLPVGENTFAAVRPRGVLTLLGKVSQAR